MRNKTYFLYITASIFVVFIFATSQMHLVLGIPFGALNPALYILPFLLGGAFGFMLARIRILQNRLETEIKERIDVENALRDHRDELETVNSDLKAFSYSVSHDLRQPLRSIREFSNILIEDFSRNLDSEAKDYLSRIHTASLKMGDLIEALLSLASVSQADIRKTTVDITALAIRILDDLKEQNPDRNVETRIEPGLKVTGDECLVKIMMDNLLHNAWKFTAKTDSPCIKVGSVEQNSKKVIYVNDNGAGFDNQQVDKMFVAFQRLHSEIEFEGTGIGLATVKRIIDRHGGNIWAEAQQGTGTTFFYYL